MNTIALTQARIGSTRFPSKILYEIDGVSLLEIHLRRILKATTLSNFLVATTHEPGSEKITAICDKLGVKWNRGSTSDVLDRFYQTIKDDRPDFVVRVTSDCALIDPFLIDEIVKLAWSNKFDYVSNTLKRTFPDGFDVEVVRFAVLEQAWKESTLPQDREHVMPWILRNSDHGGGTLFTTGNYTGENDFSAIRLTVDYASDYEVVKTLVQALGSDRGWYDYTLYMQEHPELNQRRF